MHTTDDDFNTRIAGDLDDEFNIHQRALALIRRERTRQVVDEGWTPQHDDQMNDLGVLAAAAGSYALHAADTLHPYSQGDGGNDVPESWPFDPSWWKPSSPRHDLIKAGALILAQLEQLLRADLDGR